MNSNLDFIYQILFIVADNFVVVGSTNNRNLTKVLINFIPAIFILDKSKK